MKCSGSEIVEKGVEDSRGVKGSSEKISHKGAKTQKKLYIVASCLGGDEKKCNSIFNIRSSRYDVRTKKRSRRGKNKWSE
jgi:hypothetical protein